MLDRDNGVILDCIFGVEYLFGHSEMHKLMKRSLDTARLFLAVSLLFVGCHNTSATRDESQLARGVAEDFLISTGPAGSYVQLSLAADAFTTKNFIQKFKQGSAQWYQFKAWSITSQSLDSGQAAATVRGSAQATLSWIGQTSSGSECTDPVGFRLRLVKEQGKWLVDSIEFGAAPVDNKK